MTNLYKRAYSTAKAAYELARQMASKDLEKFPAYQHAKAGLHREMQFSDCITVNKNKTDHFLRITTAYETAMNNRYQVTQLHTALDEAIEALLDQYRTFVIHQPNQPKSIVSLFSSDAFLALNKRPIQQQRLINIALMTKLPTPLPVHPSKNHHLL